MLLHKLLHDCNSHFKLNFIFAVHLNNSLDIHLKDHVFTIIMTNVMLGLKALARDYRR